MANEIISYLEMCARERTSLQQGMNFGIGGTHSVILMSLRANAPYEDRLESDGSVLVYEGHDVPRNAEVREPKRVDQQGFYPGGSPTQNGKFAGAAAEFRAGDVTPAA
jgi:hypothetical protein